LSGPEQTKVGYASLVIVPEAAIILKIIDRPRVRITIVEVLDFK
jgi:hypothetical protein